MVNGILNHSKWSKPSLCTRFSLTNKYDFTSQHPSGYEVQVNKRTDNETGRLQDRHITVHIETQYLSNNTK